MVPVAAGERTERTYGNWRKPTSPGLGQLGMLGTLILLCGLAAMVIGMMIWFWSGVIIAGVVGVVLAPLLIRDRHGRNGLQALTSQIAWWRGKSKGWHLYRSGPLGLIARGTHRLPGLVAPTRLVEAEDSYGRPFAMIVMPTTAHYTVVMECGADGAALVDQDQIDTWVAYWGQWLASLSFEPGLVSASVTIETAPDLGARLEREVTGQMAQGAPELAQQVLNEVVRSYPAGSAQVSSRVAVTYSAAPRPGAKRRSVEEMARELGTRLPGLTQGLGMTGAGAGRPMTAEQLAEAIRVAYDPSAQSDIDAAHTAGVSSGITWDNAGPGFHEEARGHYLHEDYASITWAMSDAPRGEVLSSVLTPLLAPHRDIARKRVTLLYRPHDPAEAARIVERDRKDARFRITSPNAAARDAVAVTAADQSAREEAKGAGLVRFAMLVTATVTDAAELPAAAAAVDVLAPPARIRLRRIYGAQASAFAAALPIGIVLPAHLMVPQSVRNAM
jgi:hypothetical protein